jgi:hypothetical protein
MIDWDKAQELAFVLSAVTLEARRDTLRVLLKAEGFRLLRAVPTDQLMDLHTLAEFIRLNSKRIE